jgi:RNA polymerase sigma-70 factor, ECF subfamily
VVALNRAVATSMVDGPAAALVEVEELERDGRLTVYHYLPATKAELLSRLGRPADAVVAYRTAIALAGNAVEQEFLAERVRRTAAPP